MSVECEECGDEIPKGEAVEEINDFGEGADRRYYCGIECSLSAAAGP